MAYTVTTTSADAVRVPVQRHTFYAASRYWVFYFYNDDLYFKSSTDGASWSAASASLGELRFGADFSIWWDGTYIHYTRAEQRIRENVYYRAGTPQSDGTIDWLASEQQVYNPAGNNIPLDPVIAVDSNGYPFIAFSDHNLDWRVCKAQYAVTDPTYGGQWGTGTNWNLSTVDVMIGGLVPLTNGRMYCAYSRSNPGGALDKIYGQLYDGSNWQGQGSEETVTSSNLADDFYSTWSIVSIGDDVHIVFNKDTSNDLVYVKRTYGVGWGSEVTVQASTDSGFVAPALSKLLTGNDDFYCFWLDNDDYVYYKACVNGSWDASPTQWEDETTDDFPDLSWLQCAYEVQNSEICVTYQTKTSPPYNIRHAILVIIGWGEYLPLTHAGVECDKVRFKAGYSDLAINIIDIDVYDGSWHHVYEDVFTDQAWAVKPLDQRRTVTEARIRFYNSGASSADARLYEFLFGTYPASGEKSSGRGAAVIVGVLVPVAVIAKTAIRSATIIVGNLVTASVARAVTRISSVLVGNLVTASRMIAAIKSSSTIIGVLASATKMSNRPRAAAVSIGNLVFASRDLAASRSGSVIAGIAVSASKAKTTLRVTSVSIGNSVSASKVASIARASIVLVGNLVSASKLRAVTKTASVLIGNLVSALVVAGPLRQASVVIGNLVSASRAIATERKASVLVGNLVSASRVRTVAKAATTLVGNLVTASRALAMDRDSLVKIGNLVSASRAIAITRESAVLVGNLITASKFRARTVTSSVIVGVLVTASRALSIVRKAAVAVGNLVTASRALAAIRASIVLVGNTVSAIGLFQAAAAVHYTRNAAVLIGNLVSASRVVAYPRLASVIIGELVTASGVVAYIKSASVIIGELVTASRAVAAIRTASVIVGNLASATWALASARSASVIVGNLVSALKVFSAFKLASVIVGEVLTATKVAGASRSAAVLIGNVVTASRLGAFIRSSSTIVGILVTASRTWVSAAVVHYVRSAIVYVGVAVSASRVVAYIRTSSVLVGVKVIVRYCTWLRELLRIPIARHPIARLKEYRRIRRCHGSDV